MAVFRRYLVALVVLIFLVWLAFTYVSSLFDERSVLARAIDVHGGEKRIVGTKTGAIRGTGAWHRLLGTAAFSWEEAFDGAERLRFTTRPSDPTAATLVFLAPANQWWLVAIDGKPEPGQSMVGRPESQLEPLRELVELHHAGRPLTFLPDEEVAFRPATVVKADKNVYYFDKASGLLVKFKTQIQGHHGDSALERFYSDHKDFAGVRLPTTIVEHRGGKVHSELKLVEVRLGEPIDSQVFEKP